MKLAGFDAEWLFCCLKRREFQISIVKTELESQENKNGITRKG
jgi:hypothetical protein